MSLRRLPLRLRALELSRLRGASTSPRPCVLEEHGYTAGCLKRSRLRGRRPATGARHSEERRARFEALRGASGDASAARADARINEHVAKRVQDGVEAPAAVAPRAGAASSSGVAPAPAREA
eukprot:5349850-Alexandrium_andersonii.AAC.1